MSTNLANIYATLKRKYGGAYTITYGLPPTYLVQLLGGNEISANSKSILIYKEDKNKVNSFNFVSPSKLNIKKSSSDLDLTGSPLKDDCQVETMGDMSLEINIENMHSWKLEEEAHKGILLDKVRAIISDEEIQKSINPESKGSVWILCDGADSERTLLMQYEVNNGYFSRGVITFLGICPSFTVNTQTILQQHFELAKPGSAMETFVENIYQIKSNIFLKCSWSSVAKVPSLIDLINCDVSLHQKLRIEDCEIATQDFIIQLRVLMHIRDEILSYSRTKSTEPRTDPKYSLGSGMEMDALRKDINEVMTDISGFADMDTATQDSDIEEVITRAKLRRLVDVTDKLWEILKCCSSYKDLKLAFNIVFQCAARCNVVNTPSNKNRLAEIITEVANRRLAIPCLSGSEPLELLLEIGLEKLYKDYEFILSESKICSGNTLKMLCTAENDNENEQGLPNVRKSLRNAARQPETPSSRKSLLHTNIKMVNKYQTDDIMIFKNSNFDEKDSAIRLARLFQIHCCIEHILMVHINLNLPNVYPDICEHLLRKPLPYVDYIHDSYTDEMEISLNAQDIREHLDGKDPHMRRVTIKSMNKSQCIKTTFFYSMDNVCPPGVSENFPNEDKEYIKENTYHSWLYRKIVRYKK